MLGAGVMGAQIAAHLANANADIEYVINTDKFFSKSRNCPYNGWLANGKIEHTIIAGELRYSADQPGND